MEEPITGWDTDADVATWTAGASPIGWGDRTVSTELDVPAKERARTAYFVKDLEIDLATLPPNAKVVFTVRADDGVLLKLNGEEIGRKRLDNGAVHHNTNASQAVNTAAANADPLVVEIPVSQLRNGTNRIAAETHLNYRNTPSMTFDLNATVVSQ